MRKIATFLLFLLWFTGDIFAGELNLEHLAKEYFHTRLATQQPGATEADLEAYLALLSDDVGYEHKPYRLLGEGGGGKQGMREGMTYYLGKNEGYDAKLVSIAIGHNALAIQYKGTHVYRRGGEGPILTKHFNAMDVLEIEDGEISIIREYRK
jgi:hypothetical protein